jgi:sugar lactone lactonase YvrE
MTTNIMEIDGGPVCYRNNPANKLGESPIYRASDATLHWVDIHSTPCTIHILPLDPITGDAAGSSRILEVPFDSITVIRFRKDVPGSYICGYRQGIAYLDENTGEVKVLKELIGKEDREEMTMNDGCVDPQGRLWIGSVDLKALRAGLGREKLSEGYGGPRGKLWRYESDGTVTVMETGITCGNGIGWSPDGKYCKCELL